MVEEDGLFRVRDQIVLVSGGTRGIGYALAEGFARRGARVIVTGSRTETVDGVLRQMDGLPVSGCVCDVQSAEQIRDVVSEVWQEYGRIDTLLNVAGVNRRKPALDITDEDFDYVMGVNLRGAFLMSREVGRRMVERRSGSQINILSLNTDRPLVHVAPYAASKAALGQLTRALAAEWGPFGVRVNAIAPGFILTDLTRKLWSDPQMQQWGLRNTPLGRLGKPHDLVGAALFLASAGAAFVTGQILYVDGGFHAAWHWPIPEGGGQ